MTSKQMNPRRGDQHGHFLDELHGIEHQVRRAIASRRRQLVKKLALRAKKSSTRTCGSFKGAYYMYQAKEMCARQK